jgi:urease accessory protein
MTDTAALLVLLQIADSAFPAGGFAHSFGLEQLVRDGRIATARDVERLVHSLLRQSIATSDGAGCAIATGAAAGGDLDAIERVDRALFVSKSSSELRDASTSMGLRLLQEVSLHVDAPILGSLLADVRGERTPGTHAVAFGAAAGALGVDAEDAAAALMFGSIAAILQAAMRLLPLSHRDVQSALHGARPLIASLAERASRIGPHQLASFHPMQEIASMRHRHAGVRMFAS